MSKKYKIALDKERCIGCEACLVHCKVKNRVPVGLSLNELTIEGPIDKDGLPSLVFKYRPCLHCKKPKCVPACPRQALYKREDGLVLLRSELCDGCGDCAEACPWDVPQIDHAAGKMIKCDYCLDRIEAGLDPACVTSCTTKALSFTRS